MKAEKGQGIPWILSDEDGNNITPFLTPELDLLHNAMIYACRFKSDLETGSC